MLVVSSQQWYSSTGPKNELRSAIEKRALVIVKRHEEIMDILQSGGNASAAQLKNELSRTARIHNLYTRWQSMQQELTSLIELEIEAEQINDSAMSQECKMEQKELYSEISILENHLTSAVLPVDEDEVSADAILELRSGAGGDEASLFGGELLQAYERSAREMGFKWELLSMNRTDLGGVREASVSISALVNSANSDADEFYSPYGWFQWESGVHRVQRVPINDTKIQTSTASVAVLPATNDHTDSAIPTTDLVIETMRASGAGGQHVNTTESAVRITHIPTGITATIQDERSQHKNKAKAMKLIEARVASKLKEQQVAERGQARRSLMGGGNRSERIRTYNHPQDRITDHRVNHTLHGIATSLDTMVATFAPMIRQLARDEQLEQLLEEEEEEAKTAKSKKRNCKI